MTPDPMLSKSLSLSSTLGWVLLALISGASLLSADELSYTTYHFEDNADNTVFTSSISISKTVWPGTMVLMDVELDQIKLPPVLDGVSGASRPQRRQAQEFRKNRGQIILGVEQGLGADTRVAASIYHSEEADYLSRSIIGTLTQELFKKNTTVFLKGQYSVDSVGEIPRIGPMVNRYKEVHQAGASLTQLLSPSSWVRIGYDGVRQNGFNSDPYRHLRVNTAAGAGTPLFEDVRENHPKIRFRQAAWGDYAYSFEGLDASLLLHYRYYWDDWSIESHTVGVKGNKYVTPNWIVSPEYRFYRQSAAYFWSANYTSQNSAPYLTGDYKLQAFDSNNAGLGLTYLFKGMAENKPGLEFLLGCSLSLKYFRYFNTLDFSANVMEGRLLFDF